MAARLILQVGPVLAAYLLARGHLRLRVDTVAAFAMAAAVFLLWAASVLDFGQRALVPAAFGFGAVAVTRVLWVTSGKRWLAVVGATGAVANLIPIVAFGAMPVRQQSRMAVTDAPIAEPGIVAAKHVETNADGVLVWLGDVVPIAPLRAVVSVGDVILWTAFIALGLVAARQAAPAPAVAVQA